MAVNNWKIDDTPSWTAYGSIEINELKFYTPASKIISPLVVKLGRKLADYERTAVRMVQLTGERLGVLEYTSEAETLEGLAGQITGLLSLSLLRLWQDELSEFTFTKNIAELPGLEYLVFAKEPHHMFTVPLVSKDVKVIYHSSIPERLVMYVSLNDVSKICIHNVLEPCGANNYIAHWSTNILGAVKGYMYYPPDDNSILDSMV